MKPRLLTFTDSPCYSVSAHPDLISLLGEFDMFLASLERYCTHVVQKIFRQSEQNAISDDGSVSMRQGAFIPEPGAC